VDGDDEAAIRRIHELWVETQCTWDLQPSLAFLDPDIVVFAGDGSVFRGRETLITEWAELRDAAEGQWRLETSDWTLWSSADAAWIVYEFHLRGRLFDEPFDQRGRGTELYRKRDGEWRMAVGHWSWRK
jgi:ketosteroid isomerase-like protein